jgi:hypothetical protein
MSIDWAVMLKEKEALREGMASMQLAKPEDIYEILRLFYEEGWIEFGKDDLEFLLESSPRSSFKSVYDGKIVGTVFATATPEGVYYPNSRLIDQRYRKKIKYYEEGIRFMEYIAGLSRLEVIYSAPRLVEKYCGLYGFQALCTYRRAIFAADNVKLDCVGAREITAEDIDDVCAFAKDVYRSSRSQLIRHFLARGARGFVSRGSDHRVEAFTLVRLLPRARALGPLLAVDDGAARRVLAAAARSCPEEIWQVDAEETKCTTFLKDCGIPFRLQESSMVKLARGDQSLLEDESRIYTIFSHYMS